MKYWLSYVKMENLKSADLKNCHENILGTLHLKVLVQFQFSFSLHINTEDDLTAGNLGQVFRSLAIL